MSAQTDVNTPALRKPAVISVNTIRTMVILFVLLGAFHILNTLSLADRLSEAAANAVYIFASRCSRCARPSHSPSR
ncbi:MAG: hypothetical protein Q7J82_10065 [Coriobacteriia bacterium]|nr:hypothetical protein [Coriobacteriia bacterium]